jgi:hypothetical protein
MNRKPSSQLIWKDRKALHDPASRSQTNVFGSDRYNFFMLARKDFTEPADTACHRQQGAKTAY